MFDFFLHAFLQNSIFWMGKRCWELNRTEKRTIKLKSQGIFFPCIESSIPELFLVYLSSILVELTIFYGNFCEHTDLTFQY